ncbi:hypothetical protein QQS21_000630 [Conoideocrella luteorostrata]|uniref:Methyltransferase domain-containing protein n=1 Tax=Conoideocrella luteorostrata TaxID=1105319 RepID=A0AAJ0CYG5_9HYPO|nr:hypothetical protein QQS21_000630 [Conoideocrella luteorostrata]
MFDLPSSYASLERYTNDLCGFITTPLVHQLTGGIHVNDALIYDAWQALPQDWTGWWSSLPDHRLVQHDLVNAIDEDGGPERSLLDESRPESLKNWLKALRSLALPRGQRPGPTIILPEILAARMKTKKIAEVSRATAYIYNMCLNKGITNIIDMGSGKGYISISLAYLFPHLRILSIDGSESQIAGSQSFATSLGISESRLKHVVHWIDGSPALRARIEDWAGGERCMLIGLHACGSLSEHMLRYFSTVTCIEALAVVGCCYNHIVPRSLSDPTGFPISSTLRKLDVTLSSTALMTGCQSPNNWKRPEMDSRPEGTSVFSKRRFYRAILEKIFFDKGLNCHPADGSRPAWGTRKTDVANFIRFARRAMDLLKIDYGKISDAELTAYEQRYRDCESQIAILWTLSVLCGKVVESVVAMDRYWFLKEQDAKGIDIVPIFDFKVSPRNMMVVAEKMVFHDEMNDCENDGD